MYPVVAYGYFCWVRSAVSRLVVTIGSVVEHELCSRVELGNVRYESSLLYSVELGWVRYGSSLHCSRVRCHSAVCAVAFLPCFRWVKKVARFHEFGELFP